MAPENNKALSASWMDAPPPGLARLLAHNVPVVHRPELARALYAAAEVGEPIPEALFVAVAEVMAIIYRLRKRRLGV